MASPACRPLRAPAGALAPALAQSPPPPPAPAPRLRELARQRCTASAFLSERLPCAFRHLLELHGFLAGLAEWRRLRVGRSGRLRELWHPRWHNRLPRRPPPPRAFASSLASAALRARSSSSVCPALSATCLSCTDSSPDLRNGVACVSAAPGACGSFGTRAGTIASPAARPRPAPSRARSPALHCERVPLRASALRFPPLA